MIDSVIDFAKKGSEKISTLFKELHRDSYSIERIELKIDQLDLSEIQKSEVMKICKSLHKRYYKMKDEEKNILYFQAKGHFLAIVARLFTTLAIGMGIIFIYWLAEYIDITLPLVRF